MGSGRWFAGARLFAFALAGYLQIGGDLQVIGGRDSMSGFRGSLGFAHGGATPSFAA